MSHKDLYSLQGISRNVQSGKLILDIDHLVIPEGRVSAVVGPNGAGKSTLLKMLAFLEEPDKGDILFRGKRVLPADFFSLRRLVTMVDQSPLLFYGTVARNVAFGLKVRGVPRAQWDTRIRESLSLVDLHGFEGRSVKGLSGGEIQRVAIARALVFEPEVILLDEPTAGVDTARVEIFDALIREVNARIGTSIVFSTHDLAQAYRLTDHVIHMSAGKTSDHGIENVFSGHGTHEDGWTVVRLRGGTEMKLSGVHTGPVRFSIPSSDIRIVPLSENGIQGNRFEGEITRMEVRGEKVRMRLSGEVSLRVEVAPDQMDREGLKLGSRVAAVIPPQAVRVMDD